MDNSLRYKGQYTHHRRLLDVTQILLDDANLVDFLAEAGRSRSPINCEGWNTIDGVVTFTGGTDVTFQVLELINSFDENGAAQQQFVQKGANIGPFTSGDTFQITVDEGLFFLRLHAKTGNQTQIDVLLAGGVRANVGRV